MRKAIMAGAMLAAMGGAAWADDVPFLTPGQIAIVLRDRLDSKWDAWRSAHRCPLDANAGRSNWNQLATGTTGIVEADGGCERNEGDFWYDAGPTKDIRDRVHDHNAVAPR